MSKIIQQGERQLVEIPLTLDVGSISGSKKISTPFPAGYIAVLNNSAATLYYKRGEYLGSTPPADAVQVQPSTYLSLPIEEDTKYTFFWSSTQALTQANNQAMILFSNEEIYMQANNLTTGGVASNVAVTNSPTVGVNNFPATQAVTQGSSANLNLTAATVVKGAAGRLVRISVLVAGSAAGSANDCATTGAAAVANQIASIPNTVGVIYLDWPCQTGIVVTPGTGQTLAVSYV